MFTTGSACLCVGCYHGRLTHHLRMLLTSMFFSRYRVHPLSAGHPQLSRVRLLGTGGRASPMRDAAHTNRRRCPAPAPSMGVEPDHGTRQYHGTAGPSAQCTGWGQHKVCWPDLLHSLAGHCACRHAGDSIVYGAGKFVLPGPELLTVGCVFTQLVVCLSCDDRRHNS